MLFRPDCLKGGAVKPGRWLRVNSGQVKSLATAGCLCREAGGKSQEALENAFNLQRTVCTGYHRSKGND